MLSSRLHKDFIWEPNQTQSSENSGEDSPPSAALESACSSSNGPLYLERKKQQLIKIKKNYFDISHSNEGERKFQIVLIFISLTAKDDEHFGGYVLTIFISSIENTLLRSVAPGEARWPPKQYRLWLLPLDTSQRFKVSPFCWRHTEDIGLGLFELKPKASFLH